MRYIVSVVAVVWLAVGAAEIKEASSLQPILQEIERVDAETLILLDVGDTLLQTRDAVNHKAHRGWAEAWFQRHYPHFSEEENIALIRVIMGSRESSCLKEDWPELISQAQKKGAKVVAFSRVLLPFTKGALQDVIVSKLKSFGMGLRDELPELEGKSDLFGYRDGVIQTAMLKGPVLQEALKHMSVRPKKILFVDDLKAQIESVDEACLEEGISCLAFHYTAYSDVPALNERVAHEQLRLLAEEHRWVPANNVEPSDD